jgi:hypothetical protein
MKYTLAALLFLSQAPSLFAQGAELGVNFGKVINRGNRLTGRDLLDIDQYFLDDGFRFGFRLTLNTRRFTAHELGYAYNRTKIRVESAGFEEEYSTTTHQYGYAYVVHATPEGSAVRPFVAGGGHFATFYPPGTSVSFGNGVTKFGFNYGAGVKVQVSPFWGLRVDVRDYTVPKPFDLPGVSGWLHQIEATAGFSLLF